MFKIISFFIIKLLVRLYVRVGILLSCGKHLHDRLISIRGEVWVHKSSLTLPLFIEMPVPSQESGRRVRGIDLVSFYAFLCDLFYMF
jgi:hypothetical protein